MDTSQNKWEDKATEYRLILFKAGNEVYSLNTEKALRSFCDKYLKGRYELRVVDVFAEYQSAIENGIIAVPALVIKEPLPEKMVVGSLESEEKLLRIFGFTE